MKKLFLFTQLFSVLFYLQFFSIQSFVYAETSTSQVKKKTMSRQEIIAVLGKEIKGWGEVDYWDRLFATLIQMRPLLARNRDEELCVTFYKFLLNFTPNGLDGELAESIPHVFGEIFWNNPNLIAKTLTQYPDKPLPAGSAMEAKTERHFLYKILEWGWEDFLYGRSKNDPRVIELSKRLQALNPCPSPTSCP